MISLLLVFGFNLLSIKSVSNWMSLFCTRQNQQRAWYIDILLQLSSILALYSSLYIYTDYNDMLTVQWPINTPLNQAFQCTQCFSHVYDAQAWKATHLKILGQRRSVLDYLTFSLKHGLIPTAKCVNVFCYVLQFFLFFCTSISWTWGYKNSHLFFWNSTIFTLISSFLNTDQI